MEVDEIDPIYGTKIENGFILGKTNYSIVSLYDWFMVRKCMINPMTNNLLTTSELGDIMEKFIEMNFFPNIDYKKMSSHRIVQMMEKHKILQDEINRQELKLETLHKRLELNEAKMAKARKKEKYEILIEKIKEKINNQRVILQNLKTK
jgi:hypothetical protein